MKFSTVFIGLLIVGALITGVYTLVDELAGPTGYDVSVDSQYKDSFNETISMYQEVSDKKSDIQNLTFNDPTAYLIGGSKVLSITLDFLTFPLDVGAEFIDAVTDLAGLPDWVNPFISAVMFFMVVIAFIAIVLRYSQV